MHFFCKLQTFGIRKITLALLLATLPALAGAQQRYAEEWPVIGYGSSQPDNAFTRALATVDADSLEHDPAGSGYLNALLELLEIDPASQVLVWSKTSLKRRFIEAANPRSLFFNDEVYVGFVPGSSSLEIAVMDPALGPVFYDFFQDPAAEARIKREDTRCLRCHDTYSMTGGGVPRFMLMSVLAGPDGETVSHEISEVTDTSTPLHRRWGGWYVTGRHGSQETLANFIISDTAMLRDVDLLEFGNRETLEEFVDLDVYPRATSDIVALLVLEHQVEVQNRITRLNYESRTLLAADPAAGPERLDALIRPLLDSLFMAHEAPLEDSIEGVSGFDEYFEQQGPVDGQGRSLRELDLETRTFRFPLSYLIYSPAIKALPTPVRERLFGQISDVLTNAPGAVDYPHINADQRGAIRAILADTYPQVLQ